MDAMVLLIALPLAGFLVLMLAGQRLSEPVIGAVGAGSVGLAALVAASVTATFSGERTVRLWQWMAVGDLEIGFDLRLDGLALVMVGVVTGVGFLIHLYAVRYMADEPDLARFFASMNLFVASMLLLVLADDLVLLYLGWEGVGLCSYLLIGFWYRDAANGRAAQKAFVVTRIGDAAMAVGLMLLFAHTGTLSIPEAMAGAEELWSAGDPLAAAVAALLLAGAVGKSAQIPLQTWLPDAMAGPTPVSALIHAATMVTAGVYLVARTHVIFELAPAVAAVVAGIGAATLLLAGLAALAQREIKRVLAYSTISQLGYMFLALGVGAYHAAIFHLVTHAFFKALLFLAAGVVIHALGGENDIFRMGGLRTRLPVVFWTFLAGSAALAGFPLVTAGFYSKDLILWKTFTSTAGGPLLWAVGLLGAGVTAMYIFRVVFLVFFSAPAGEREHEHGAAPSALEGAALVVLAALAIGGGLLETPHHLGGVHILGATLSAVLPAAETAGSLTLEIVLQLVAAVTVLIGIGVAWRIWGRPVGAIEPATGGLARAAAAGFGFDWLYDRAVVRPFHAVAEAGRGDVVDQLLVAVGWLCTALSWLAGLAQTGRVRWYAAGVGVGAALLLAMAVLG
jgi:NADH-quinone oxidoreductase subunit L